MVINNIVSVVGPVNILNIPLLCIIQLSYLLNNSYKMPCLPVYYTFIGNSRLFMVMMSCLILVIDIVYKASSSYSYSVYHSTCYREHVQSCRAKG